MRILDVLFFEGTKKRVLYKLNWSLNTEENRDWRAKVSEQDEFLVVLRLKLNLYYNYCNLTYEDCSVFLIWCLYVSWLCLLHVRTFVRSDFLRLHHQKDSRMSGYPSRIWSRITRLIHRLFLQTMCVWRPHVLEGELKYVSTPQTLICLCSG